MNFKNWLNESANWNEGVQLFQGILSNFTEEDRVLVFCDWLEESGFHEVSLYIRPKITKKGYYYYARAKEELKQHDIDVDGDIIYIGLNKQAYRPFFRLLYNQPQENRKNVWKNIDLNKYPVLVPAFAFVLFSRYNEKLHNSYEQNINSAGLNNLLGHFSSYFYRINRIVIYGRELSRKELKEFQNITQDCIAVFNKIPNRKDIVALNHFKETVQNIIDYLQENDWMLSGNLKILQNLREIVRLLNN